MTVEAMRPFELGLASLSRSAIILLASQEVNEVSFINVKNDDRLTGSDRYSGLMYSRIACPPSRLKPPRSARLQTRSNQVARVSSPSESGPEAVSDIYSGRRTSLGSNPYFSWNA